MPTFEWTDFNRRFNAFDRTQRLPKLARLILGMTSADLVTDRRAAQIAIYLAEQTLDRLVDDVNRLQREQHGA